MSATAPRVNGHSRSRTAPPRAVPVPEPTGPRSLDEALFAFQKQAPKLARDAEGQVQNRSYRYVTLDALLDAIVPLLIEHELVWRTWPTSDNQGQPALRYRMTHVPSGDFDEEVMPLMCAKPDPQGQGSALTYARRYALLAYLNLAPGDDDDGLAASTGRPPVDRYADVQVPTLDSPEHNPAPPRPVAAAAKPSERPATAKQRSLIWARAQAIELTAEELANILKVAGGEEATTWQPGAAERWSKRALERLPARLVDVVLAAIQAKS